MITAGSYSLGLAIVPLCHGTGAPLRRNEGAPFEKMKSGSRPEHLE